jgi:hypothetical protein
VSSIRTSLVGLAGGGPGVVAQRLRAVVAALQGRHAVVVERDVRPGVRQRGPDDVLDARGLRGVRHGAGVRPLPLHRDVLPERRDEERAVRALQRLQHARLVVEVRGHDLGAARGERLRGLGAGLAGDGAYGELPAGVVQDGAGQAAALLSRGSDHSDDLLFRHCERLPVPITAGLFRSLPQRKRLGVDVRCMAR